MPSRRPRSARPSTRSSARPCRTGPAPIGSRTATPPTAAMPRARSATSCCRRCTRCTSARVGSARAALNYIARRLTIPPADVYGVATFYALFSVEPRPPRVLHVCDDLACRCAGSRGADRGADRARRPAGIRGATGTSWLPSPCLGQCDRAPAALLVESGAGAARARADQRRGRSPARGDGRRDAGATPLGGAAPGRPARAAAARPDRRGRSGEPRRLPRARRLRGAAARVRARPRRRDPRGARLQADGARRRRLPDRAQVGGGRPPAAPPALPDLQRGRVRARHVQGSGDPRGRSVLGDRGDDDRRLRDRLRARLHLPARRVPARPAPA